MKSLQCLSLSRESVAVTNILTASFLPASLPLDKAILRNVSVTASLAPLETSVTEWVFSLYVHLNGLWRIDFSNLDLLSLQTDLHTWLEASAANTYAALPEALCTSVLQRIFLPTLDTISAFIGNPLVFVGPPSRNVQTMFRDCILLVVSVDACPTTVVRVAWQDAATASAFLGFLKGQPVRQPDMQASEFFQRVQIDARLRIGSMRLSPHEIESLVAGDVLLPDEIYPFEPKLFLSGKSVLLCTLEGKTLCITGAGQERGEDRMSDVDPNAEQALLTNEALHALELDIAFELPGMKLSLEEIGKLVVGQTFTLEYEVKDVPIRICVGGQTYALGRLVDVGGQAGVQITKLSATQEKGGA
ncbi:MAG: type III secretion system cytoplasmic ring protein SctQ [Desulfovibrionaceae bacterium]|nr:type III secretion system cytoplasmic ring protein SctQ [Desulfovibrionaceae bacterium]